MSSLITIYRKRNFNVYDAGSDQYIVHNTDLDFTEHHSHIRNFKTCKFIIDLSLHKTIPKRLSNYLIVSLIRLTADEDYKEKLNKILSIDKDNRKGTSYRDKKNSYKNKKRGVKYHGRKKSAIC